MARLSRVGPGAPHHVRRRGSHTWAQRSEQKNVLDVAPDVFHAVQSMYMHYENGFMAPT